MKRSLLALLLWLISLSAFAAPAFDAAANGKDITGAASTLTVSFTAAAVANTVLYVGVEITSATNTQTITGVTYNGVSMGTAVWSAANSVITSRAAGFVLALGTPDGSAHNIVVTASGTCTDLALVVQSWNGVDQSTPIRTVPTAVSETGGNVNASITVSAAVAGDTILSSIRSYNGTITPGQTSRSVANNFDFGGGSIGTSSTTASGGDAMTWTIASAGYYMLGAVSLVPAAGASAPKTLMLLGVGD